jgi:hypothetical protein
MSVAVKPMSWVKMDMFMVKWRDKGSGFLGAGSKVLSKVDVYIKTG